MVMYAYIDESGDDGTGGKGTFEGASTPLKNTSLSWGVEVMARSGATKQTKR